MCDCRSKICSTQSSNQPVKNRADGEPYRISLFSQAQTQELHETCSTEYTPVVHSLLCLAGSLQTTGGWKCGATMSRQSCRIFTIQQRGSEMSARVNVALFLLIEHI